MNARSEIDMLNHEDPAEAGPTTRAARGWWRLALTGVALYAATVLVLGVYWSVQPGRFDVRAVAVERLGGESELVSGAVTVSTIKRVAETLLEKPGGYVYNDITLPGLYLDNMPSWEYGALKELRDALRSLRNDFSRSQTQSIENANLRKADALLNYDVNSWILPTTESEYRSGIDALGRYLDDLKSRTDPSARFYTRADNLAAYLAVVEKRLGNFAQRLSASVGDSELTAALVPVQGGEETPGEVMEVRVQTPWLEVDNVFYEARGYAWALLHTMKALAVEFEPVLRDKNAEVSIQQVIRDLQEATRRMWSPVVLNGSGFGLISNHSLILASYLSRANAAVLDLRILLQQG
ncbi:MAG: DUF2333 family protein [Chromatiaceae bacterium]|jgi:hypothetical protein